MKQVSIHPVYRLDDFCKSFGISRSMAYAEIKAGRLHAFTIGDRRMVAGEDALAWRDAYRNTGFRRTGFRRASCPNAA